MKHALLLTAILGSPRAAPAAEARTGIDRVGMINLTKPGGQTRVFFGDLTLDGRALDLRSEPQWEASGNRATSAKGAGGANDVGFSDKNHTGGSTGEAGGTIWRMGKLWASYADRIGPLAFDDALEASGRVMLEVGAPDSGMLFGWFKSDGQEKSPDQAGSFVGVRIAGPLRVGHYFASAFTAGKGAARVAGKGPVLSPGKVCDSRINYDPASANGLGTVRATLNGETFTFDLKKGDKSQAGDFDRFGLVSIRNDGGHSPVRIWFDALKYTSAHSSQARIPKS